MKQKVKNITYLYITSQINLDSKKNRDLGKQNTYLDRQWIQHKFKLEGPREMAGVRGRERGRSV